jgi:diguanylate cyclase (GGDEF)-like protein
LFNEKIDNNKLDELSGQHDQDLNRGLALLIIIAMSVVGASWLFALPVYFDLKIATQVFPLLYSVIALFSVARLQHRYLNLLAVPISYIVIFSSWAYVIYLNVGMIKDPAIELSAQLAGISNSMYLLGLCLVTIWLGRYFKFAIYLSSIATVILMGLLFVFVPISITFLLAVGLLLASSVFISLVIFKTQVSVASTTLSDVEEMEDLLLPAEFEEQEISPELEIDVQPLNETSVSYDWDLILRELHGELKNTADVDQLFKRMLTFLHGAMEFNSAAVGMLQDKNLKKIATYGDDELLHTQSLNWTNQRINELFSSREPMISKQVDTYQEISDTSTFLHRLDVPVISNQKVVGVVTLFRENVLFDTHDIQLASSIVFHSMVALRQARMQDEIKRLSSNSSINKLTVYSREQFVNQVKPVFEKLSKPRECSLFIVEIDKLDSVIDNIGRDAGAILYKSVSNLLMSLLKESDVLGKYGKEGFIVLLDETNLIEAKTLTESVRQKIQALKVKYQEHVLSTTVSIGLTIVSNENEDLPSLMRKADMGLFVAKENGCNTVKVSL